MNLQTVPASTRSADLSRALLFNSLESQIKWVPLKAIWKVLREPIKQKVRDEVRREILQTLVEYNES